MKIAAAKRTALGATLAMSALALMSFLAAHRFDAAAGALMLLGPGWLAFFIHAEAMEQEREETEGRRVRALLEQRLADGLNRLKEAQVALQAEALERQRSKEQLRRADEEVRSRVSARTREIEQANEKLIRTHDEIQTFYHTLSHELKTPLTAAREFISIVLDGLGGSLNPTQTEYLRVALDSCDQLRVCMNDLLDVARLETGKLSIQLRAGAVEGLVKRAVTTVASVALERGITLHCTSAPNLPPVLMDEARISQVVTNLLNNAFKFTARGGSVSIRVEECLTDDDFLQIVVRDTGRGIAADQLDHIFDRLYQIRTGDAASEMGLGLGLYLCRELVRLHGGEITVESKVGRGSAFTFTLPRQRAPRRLDEPTATILVGGSRDRTVTPRLPETLLCSS